MYLLKILLCEIGDPQEYYVKLGNGNWKGGKHLVSSGVYTGYFCRAILKCWLH